MSVSNIAIIDQSRLIGTSLQEDDSPLWEAMGKVYGIKCRPEFYSDTLKGIIDGKDKPNGIVLKIDGWQDSKLLAIKIVRSVIRRNIGKEVPLFLLVDKVVMYPVDYECYRCGSVCDPTLQEDGEPTCSDCYENPDATCQACGDPCSPELLLGGRAICQSCYEDVGKGLDEISRRM